MSQTAYHWIIKTGDYYLTWNYGYSLDIANAMHVEEDNVLIGNQELVRIKVSTLIELLYFKRNVRYSRRQV